MFGDVLAGRLDDVQGIHSGLLVIDLEVLVLQNELVHVSLLREVVVAH